MRRSGRPSQVSGVGRPLVFVGVDSGSHRAHLQADLDARGCGSRCSTRSGDVPFDFYAWLLTDPETCVGSAPAGRDAVVGRPPSPHPTEVPDPTNRWTNLESRPTTLVDSTNGDRSSSRVWNELLVDYGIDDVSSIVFRDQYGCWAFLDLWRSDGDFTNEECSRVASVVAKP